MRLEALEARGFDDGPLRRLDTRLKLLASFGFILGVVATPPGAWRLLGAEAMAIALTFGLSGLSPWGAFRRWLALAPPVVGLGALAAIGHPDLERIGFLGLAGSIVARNSLAVLTLLILSGVTPFQRLLAGLRRLGVPAFLVATLHFMSRYLQVLTDQLSRMLQARRSRSFRRRAGPGWWSLGGILGALMLRSAERGERVHLAMLARGWDGTIRNLDDP